MRIMCTFIVHVGAHETLHDEKGIASLRKSFQEKERERGLRVENITTFYMQCCNYNEYT